MICTFVVCREDLFSHEVIERNLHSFHDCRHVYSYAPAECLLATTCIHALQQWVCMPPHLYKHSGRGFACRHVYTSTLAECFHAATPIHALRQRLCGKYVARAMQYGTNHTKTLKQIYINRCCKE